MKLKHLWLPMIILTLVGGGAKICNTVMGGSFFLDSSQSSVAFLISLVVLLILGFILSTADRKGNFTAEPVKDVMCGIFGFIASVSIIGGGVISLLGLPSSESLPVDLFNCIFAFFGGAVFLFESCISFTGHNSMKKLPVLTLVVPLWCCGRFISLFMDYSKVSIQATEMFDIISTALLLLFLFYQSMFFAQVNNKFAVRKLSSYGMAFVMCALVVTIDIIIKMTMPAQTSVADTYNAEPTLTKIISCIGDLAFCGYALFLMKDIFKNAQKGEKQKKIKKDVSDDDKAEKNQSDDDNSNIKTVQENGVLNTLTAENVLKDSADSEDLEDLEVPPVTHNDSSFINTDVSFDKEHENESVSEINIPKNDTDKETEIKEELPVQSESNPVETEEIPEQQNEVVNYEQDTESVQNDNQSYNEEVVSEQENQSDDGYSEESTDNDEMADEVEEKAKTDDDYADIFKLLDEMSSNSHDNQ